MKRIIAISILLFSTSVCFASGGNDYTLDIGYGYSVFRANSMDVGICNANGRVILSPDKENNVGPVIQYIMTPEHIFTKNY